MHAIKMGISNNVLEYKLDLCKHKFDLRQNDFDRMTMVVHRILSQVLKPGG